jgi:hypothetical protein
MKNFIGSLLKPRGSFRTDMSPATLRERRDSRVNSCRLEQLELRELLSAATQLAFAATPPNGFANTALTPPVQVDVEDVSNAIVTTDSSAVTISIASGPAGGVLTGTRTVHAVDGVASFGHLFFSKPGTYTVHVIDGALTAATSSTFTIAAPPVATSLSFEQEPTENPTEPKITPPIVVDVKDQYGNVLTTGNEVVTLSVFSGPDNGKLIGTVHEAAIDGVATFTGINVTKGGTYVLSASTHELTVNSTSFAMGGPKIATSLVFLQGPTDVVAGQDMTPAVTVQVLDQFGNVLTTDHSVVKLTVNTGPSTKGVFAANIKDGVATFSNVLFDKAGAYTLRASDGSVTPVTSSSFNVTAAAATHFAFTQIPGNGTSHTQTFTVVGDLLDQFNNIATGSSLSLALSDAAAPHGATPLDMSTNAVAGVATWAGVTFSEAGKYVLAVTHNGITHKLSLPFTLI